MTRNWTDYPLSGAIPRKKIHITELMEAYEERIRLMRANEWYGIYNYPLPVFIYYHTSPSTGKLWGPYPMADPAHWPPNESPDNKFRNDHIYGTRGLLVGWLTYGDGSQARPHEILKDTTMLGSARRNFYEYFIDVDTGKYICFANVADFLTASIGSANWTDTTLTVGSTNVKALHVQEQRDCWEKLQQIIIGPHIMEYRTKSGYSTGHVSAAAAYAAAKNDFAGNSWGSWNVSGREVNIWGHVTYSGSDYGASVGGQEVRYTFDLDLEISDMGWSILPPLSAKLITYGLDIDDDNVSDVLIKCVTTGKTNSLSHQDADGRGYLLDLDITDYVGSGHSEQIFHFSSIDEFSSSDLDKVYPGGAGTVLAGTSISQPSTRISPVMAWVILEPNWKYGTE